MPPIVLSQSLGPLLLRIGRLQSRCEEASSAQSQRRPPRRLSGGWHVGFALQFLCFARSRPPLPLKSKRMGDLGRDHLRHAPEAHPPKC